MRFTEPVRLEEYINSLPPTTFIFPENADFELKHSLEKNVITLLGGINELETTSYIINNIIKAAIKENLKCLYITPTYKVNSLDNTAKEVLTNSGDCVNTFYSKKANETSYAFTKQDIIDTVKNRNISLIIVDSLEDFIERFFTEKGSKHSKKIQAIELFKSIQHNSPASILYSCTTKSISPPSSDAIKDIYLYCSSPIVLLLSEISKTIRLITNIRNFKHQYSPTTSYSVKYNQDGTTWKRL